MNQEILNSGDQLEAAAPVDENTMEPQGQEQQEPQQVPLDALQAERAERQRLQDELKMVKDNMSLMMSQYQSQAKQSQEQADNLSDDDVLTVGEFKKALQQKEQQYNMSIQELRMTQKYPDYEEVITKYLPEVFKTTPGLRKTLEQTQDFELAYYLSKNSDAYRSANKKAKTNADAERIVQNSQRAGSLSSVGATSPISQAKRFRDMSDDEFMAIANRNRGYA